MGLICSPVLPKLDSANRATDPRWSRRRRIELRPKRFRGSSATRSDYAGTGSAAPACPCRRCRRMSLYAAGMTHIDNAWIG